MNTTDPDYYRWTQWIFVQMFNKGLASKEEMPINWCPSCKIGLANEEVVNGKCERCGSEVERRTIAQWVLKITKYADRLIEGLEKTRFVEKAKKAQINWIGRSRGALIRFQISDFRCQVKELEVFTTRPDTIFGATFMVIAPEHELVKKVLQSTPNPSLDKEGDLEGLNKKEIMDYVENSRKKSEMERTELAKEKTGVFSGLYAINPATGKEIPIWISDFVLASYGTGAIMSVPAHDSRDEDFAKKYGLPIVTVVEEDRMVNSGFLNGLGVEEATKTMVDWLREKGIGEASNSYHLRDWIFSRQHYWGEPIPMISCPKDGWVPVPEDQLPVRLPEVEHYEPTDTGESPLAKLPEFVNTTCPVCGGPAKRETDTMPNWAGSDWYYLAYCFADKLINSKQITNPKSQTTNGNNIFSESKKELDYWMPVDVYFGGDEHTTLHLLYSRFIYKYLFDLGVVPGDEPYDQRVAHGVILGPDGARMSKSKGNVIVPGPVADKYGADVLRMYLMFMGPYDATMAWNEKTLMGVKRFLDRFEKYARSQISGLRSQIDKTTDSSREIKMIMNKLVAGVTKDLEEFGYNTAVAKMMEGLNKVSDVGYQMSNEEIKTLIKLIAPFAPYMAEELWSFDKLRTKDDPISVHIAKWPEVNKEYLVEETVIIPVSINGKRRDEMTLDRLKVEDSEGVIKIAKEREGVKKWIEGKKVIREVYVPGRMINLVVE